LKNKWLAAILNILPGAGYLYLGVRTPFAVVLLLMLPVALIAGTADPALNGSNANTPISWGIFAILATPLIAFVVDAFNETKRANELLSAKPKVPTVKKQETSATLKPQPIPQHVVGKTPINISVSMSKSFRVGQFLVLSCISFSAVWPLTDSSAGHLLAPSVAIIIVALLIGFLYWLFIIVASKARYELHGSMLMHFPVRKTLNLEQLTQARMKSRSSLLLKDADGNSALFSSRYYSASALAPLFLAIRPYVLARAVEKDDTTVAKLDAFVERYGAVTRVGTP
jgi:hypothetical protein